MPAQIVVIPGNYAIEVIRDAIAPEDVEMWVQTWHLDMQLDVTRDRKIRIWLKSKPVSKQKKRKPSAFQNLLGTGGHDSW